ncbi:MAG TPA: nuclear transport factor 2 family protein [Gemmatimonadaceae bacterium]|nr:nuclear transport factor 2 family protein [Gemmatimonadaceae bacterium]
MKATIVLTVVVAVAACNTAPATPAKPSHDMAADVKAVEDVRNREMTMLNGMQMDSIWTLYSDDVVFMSPDEAMVSGKPAVKKWMDDSMKQAMMSGSYSGGTVTVDGDLAVDRYTGTLTVTPKAAKAMSCAIKGLHVLKRQADGKWLITQDIWNCDAPMGAAPPPAKK